MVLFNNLENSQSGHWKLDQIIFLIVVMHLGAQITLGSPTFQVNPFGLPMNCLFFANRVFRNLDAERKCIA